MTSRALPKLAVGQNTLNPVLDGIRRDLDIPAQFTPEALAEAEGAAEEWRAIASQLPLKTIDWAAHCAAETNPVNAVQRLPLEYEWPELHYLHGSALPEYDATSIPFVTIDPAESMDLDQALYLADLGPDGRHGRYLVNYAIASVPTFVRPASALDVETWERGTTVYLPDQSTPLHPPVLSHGAASLLPDQIAPACVWSICLDHEGHAIHSRVDRALVRSRAKLSYEQVDAAARGNEELPADVPDDLVGLLKTIGELRLSNEAARGGVSARIPEQEFESHDGWYTLNYRANLPVEEWNAQISLLTGIRAAKHMRAANVGIMRTLPPADERDLARMRRIARALGVKWPHEMNYAELVPALNPDIPAHAAFLLEATSLFRGSGYRAFGVKDTKPLPASAADGIIHAAIAAEYAHVTAPLRRLVDRYGEEVCIAQCAGRDVPEWVRDSLEELPSAMRRSSQRAHTATRLGLAVIQSLMMHGREGEQYTGTVVDVSDKKSTIMLSEPAVMGTVYAKLDLGSSGRFRLVEANLESREIVLAPVESLVTHH
ncbi:MAG: RNB domain-containing ribonuclease [Actinomycetaceae bacterium]|nr:RNB domain-containing ribonuclease [Actinomycetaceae bacterium]